MSKRFDAFNATAIRCHGVPDGWMWHGLDAHNVPDGYTKVTGSVPIGVFQRGPRKGRTKWGKDSQTLWMKDDDIRESKRIWERENDKCVYCYGEGETCYRVAMVDGKAERSYRECTECKGTGKPLTEVNQ
jgi:hypothetical protein